LCRGRGPLHIQERDVLARELCSGHVKNSGRLEVNAFIASAKSSFGISLHRWCKAPERLFKSLGLAAAKRRRGGQKFKGFARFDADALKLINIDASPQLRVVGVPTIRNPFHADIPLPPDREVDYYLLVATEIIAKAKPKTLLYGADKRSA